MPHHQRVAVSPKVVLPHLAGTAWTSLATALFPLSGRQKLGGRKRGRVQVESLWSPGLELDSLDIELILTSGRQNTKTSFQSIDSKSSLSILNI